MELPPSQLPNSQNHQLRSEAKLSHRGRQRFRITHVERPSWWKSVAKRCGREVSNYLEGEVSAALRSRVQQEHFKGCKRCAAVVDGTRNVAHWFGNAAALDLPARFSD
jgi:hypothetical protein